MVESNEIAPVTEATPSPERIQFNPHMEGLQGRMLLYDHDPYSLSPDEDVTYQVNKRDLGRVGFRNYRVFNYASTLERVDQWADVDTGPDTKYQAWQKEMQRIVGGNTRRAQELTSLNEQLGIDFMNFDEHAARTIYDRYFRNQQEEITIINGEEVYVPSHIKLFVLDAVRAFSDREGNNLNYESLKQHLSSYQWFAHIFGKNSSEIVAQLIDAEAKLRANPDPFIASLNHTEPVTKDDGATADVSRLNKPRLDEREVELVTFLNSQLERIRVAPPPEPKTDKPDSTKKSPYVWHYHRNDKRDNHFPYQDYARSLLAPLRVATQLQREFPQEYGNMSLVTLEQEIYRSQQEVHHRYNLDNIRGVLQTALTDYERFLTKQYGMQDFHEFANLDVQLIGSKARQLYPRTLGFMFSGAPSIYLNMQIIEEIARREKIDLQLHPEVAIRRVLNEVIPHEYTHIIGEQAHWYLMRRHADPKHDYPINEIRRSAYEAQPGKLGPMLTKPPGGHNADGTRIKGLERGRWLMEAVTVRLTEEWAAQTELGVSKNLNVYPFERDVLDAVIRRLIIDGDVPDEQTAFKYFADAYFKQGGVVALVRKLDGDGLGTDGTRKRPHYTQTLYALMEYDKMRNTDTEYDLSEAFAYGSMSPLQRQQLRMAVQESMNPNSKVQLSPAARAYLNRTYELGLNIPSVRARQENLDGDTEQLPKAA